MKTLIYRLRKFNLPIEEKVKIYSLFYERHISRVPLEEEPVIRHYLARNESIVLTERYLKIYGERLNKNTNF